jgi:glutamine synthetase
MTRNAEHGISKLMGHYVAGLLTHAREITYFLAPYINSYKRFQAGTFAPTRAIWSFDNRTAGYRLCGADSKAVRIECRVGGPTSTPTSPLPPCWRPASTASRTTSNWKSPSRAMPTTPSACARSPRPCARPPTFWTARACCASALGDGVVDHYVHTARWEQGEYDRRVTDWEIRRGFEQY